MASRKGSSRNNQAAFGSCRESAAGFLVYCALDRELFFATQMVLAERRQQSAENQRREAVLQVCLLVLMTSSLFRWQAQVQRLTEGLEKLRASLSHDEGESNQDSVSELVVGDE